MNNGAQPFDHLPVTDLSSVSGVTTGTPFPVNASPGLTTWVIGVAGTAAAVVAIETAPSPDSGAWHEEDTISVVGGADEVMPHTITLRGMFARYKVKSGGPVTVKRQRWMTGGGV